MLHQIFRIQFSESFSTTTSVDRHLWFTYLIEISYSQPRSMRSPAVMSSAPCRWRPRCITAYPSLVRPGVPRGTVQRVEPSGSSLPRNWCWYAVRKCRWSGSPLMPTKHLDARLTRVDHDATHQLCSWRVQSSKYGILFQDSAPAARQCSFQKYSH